MTAFGVALIVWLSTPQLPQTFPAIIRGTVVDAATNAPLRDVLVQLIDSGKSVRTGVDGRFEFPKVSPGTHTITVSTIGYIFVKRRVKADSDSILDITIPLAEGAGTYQETVTVSTDAARPADLGVSSQHDLGSAGLQALRGVAGDDPMRAVQSLPGVVTGDEFQSQFSVRGSAFRQVGIVIDGVATPLLLSEIRGRNDTGSIAMINSDILDHASLESGARPLRDGEWLGATIDFGVREGSRDKTQMRGALSGTSASLVVDGPFGSSHKGSWLISARKSYLGWLIQKIAPEIDSSVNFGDVQSKIVYDLTSHQQIQLLLIGGDATYTQNLNLSTTNGLSRANSRGAVASAAWRYATNTLLITQRYSFSENRFENTGLLQQNLGTGTERQLVWRGDASWSPWASWTIEGGGKVEARRQSDALQLYALASGQLRPTISSGFAGDTTERGAWAQVARRTESSGVAVGARYANDSLSGWHGTLPWLLAEHKLGSFMLRGGAGASAQVPDIDTQYSATAPLKTESAVSVDASIEHGLTKTMRWQFTAFARDETNGLRREDEDRLVNGVHILASPFPLFASTLTGQSRGFEVLVRRRATSGLIGWVAYTYAHTHDHDTQTLESFDGDYDQRHTLNIFAQQKLSYRTTINAKLRVGSNVPLAGYFAGTIANLTLSDKPNQVRLPLYARLDLRADRTLTFDRGRLTLFVEVVNVLNRVNIRQAAGSISGTLTANNWTQREIPFVPSIGMLIEF